MQNGVPHVRLKVPAFSLHEDVDALAAFEVTIRASFYLEVNWAPLSFLRWTYFCSMALRFLRLPHRAFAAFVAALRRCSGVKFLALAKPPLRPSITAAEFILSLSLSIVNLYFRRQESWLTR